jgi:hypothetical protein
MWPGKIHCFSRQESFAQQEKEYEATWYCGYSQSPKESLCQETLQPLQEAWGAYTMHNTRDCRQFEKDGTEKSDFHAAKKGGKKPNPTKQYFAQLSKKLDQLEKVIKKKDTKK